MIRIKSGAAHRACEKAQSQMVDDLCHPFMKDCRYEILQNIKSLDDIIERSRVGFCTDVSYEEYQKFKDFID